MSTPAQARAESLLSAEKRTLEMIANGASLPDVLNDLCLTIDAHAPGVISTVLLMDPDGKRLWPGAGPRFPADLIPAISPWPIGANRGACGTAAFLKQRVIISDLTTDPRWPDDYRALAVSHGLRAAWSEPLISKDGAVLGTFAMYYAEPRTPDTSDLELIETAGDIALIAIQMERSQATLRENEERFRLAMSNVASGVYTLDLQGLVTYVNPAAEKMFGWTNAELLGKKMHDVTHYKRPDGSPFPGSDCPGLQVLQKGIELREHEDMFIRKDGSFFPVVYSASALQKDGQTVGIVVGFRDDTLRREGERAAREGEERFQAIIDTAPALIWMSGPDKACTYVNKTWLDFTGRSMEAELASSWAEGIHPDDLQRCMDTYTQSFDRREKFRTEYRLRRHDGEYRWVLDEGVPRFDRNGSLAGYIGIGIDITDRELAEREITLANDRLRLAMESGKSVAWEWDVQSGRDSWFGDLKTMFGIPSDTYVGNVEDFRRRVHSEDRGLVWRAINDAMRGHAPYAAEFRVVWPDGTVRWVAANGKFYYSKEGKPERMLGVAIDITDRKLAEEVLRESEERYRLALQAGRMYAFDWDAVTDVIVRSEESTRIFGLSGEPIRLTKRELLARVHPEDRTTFSNSLAKCTPESPNTQISYRLLRPDGSVRWLERTAHALFDEQGRMVRMIGMVTDITERKRAEEALSRVGGKLIEAQEQERTRIARELHDDIGQRLALLAWYLGSSNGNLRKQVEDLANDVQALSHQLHSPKLDYLGLAAAAAGFCTELSDRQRVEIEFHSENIPKELPKEISLCLFRVLQEALQNAIKHSGSRQFQVLLRGGANEIELTVHDSGIGFEPEEAIKGRGLGLISMKERLKLVNGELSIDSGPQRGTIIHARVALSRTGTSAGAVG